MDAWTVSTEHTNVLRMLNDVCYYGDGRRWDEGRGRGRENSFPNFSEFQMEINANWHRNEEIRCVSRALFSLLLMFVLLLLLLTTITLYTLPLPLWYLLMPLLLNRKMCWNLNVSYDNGKSFATYARIVYFHRQQHYTARCYKSEKSVQKKEIIHAACAGAEDGGKYTYNSTEREREWEHV